MLQNVWWGGIAIATNTFSVQLAPTWRCRTSYTAINKAKSLGCPDVSVLISLSALACQKCPAMFLSEPGQASSSMDHQRGWGLFGWAKLSRFTTFSVPGQHFSSQKTSVARVGFFSRPDTESLGAFVIWVAGAKWMHTHSFGVLAGISHPLERRERCHASHFLEFGLMIKAALRWEDSKILSHFCCFLLSAIVRESK